MRFDKCQRLIGLTGGIATGKSTVAEYCRDRYGLPILDADIYAREAVAKGSSILDEIVNRYGAPILLSNGSLDRAALAEIIFSDPAEKVWLENKIHPYVRDRFQSQLQQIQSQMVILVVPLLFEANFTDLVTEIWVVYCDLNQQIARIMTRNSLSKAQALERIANQLPLQEKIAAADFVLDNSTTIADLYAQIDLIIDGKTTRNRKQQDNS